MFDYPHVNIMFVNTLFFLSVLPTYISLLLFLKLFIIGSRRVYKEIIGTHFFLLKVRLMNLKNPTLTCRRIQDIVLISKLKIPF